MAGFSVSDTAFSGFRIVREHPRAVAIWAGGLLVYSLVKTTILASVFGPELMQLQQLAVQPNADLTQSLAVLRRLAPMYAVMAPLTLAFYAVAYAAMNRAVLRPADDRFGYLRLGADELRQFGLWFLYGLLLLVVFILLILAMGIVVALATVMFSADGKPAAVTGPAGLIVFLGVSGVLAGMIWFMVRLSLASPLTFASGRIDLFGSWALTRGHAWRILGTYVVAFLLVVVVSLLGLTITRALMAVAGGGMTDPTAVFKLDLSTASAALSPVRLIYMVGSAIIFALTLPVSLAPPAAIYWALRAPKMDENGAPIDSLFS